MNVFKEMGLSMFRFESYKEFLSNRKRKIFGYGLLLILLYFIITIIVPFIQFQMITGGVEALVEEHVPDFSLADGKFKFDSVVKEVSRDAYIWIDTFSDEVFAEEESTNRILRNYSSVILMDQDTIVIKNNTQFETFNFADLGSDISFDKQDLMKFIPAFYTIAAVVCVVIYIAQVIGFFIGALVLSVIGMIVVSFAKSTLSFGQIFIISVYAKTLPLVIKAVCSLFSITIPGMGIISFGLSIFYVSMAVKKIKELQEQESVVAVREENE